MTAQEQPKLSMSRPSRREILHQRLANRQANRKTTLRAGVSGRQQGVLKRLVPLDNDGLENLDQFWNLTDKENSFYSPEQQKYVEQLHELRTSFGESPGELSLDEAIDMSLEGPSAVLTTPRKTASRSAAKKVVREQVASPSPLPSGVLQDSPVITPPIASVERPGRRRSRRASRARSPLSKDLSTATTPLFRKTRSTQQEINYVSFLEDTVADEVQSDSSDDEFEANSDESDETVTLNSMDVSEGDFTREIVAKYKGRDDLLSETTDGLRRSKRRRIKPLAYWRNERVVYGRDDEDETGEIIVDCIQNPNPRETPKREERRRKINKSKKQFESEANKKMRVYDAGSKKEVPMLVSRSEADILENATEYAEGGRKAVAFESEKFSAGKLVVPIGYATNKTTSKETQIYSVQTGKFRILINQSVFSLGRGGQFFVPVGNEFEIRNVGRSNGTLSYVNVK